MVLQKVGKKIAIGALIKFHKLYFDPLVKYCQLCSGWIFRSPEKAGRPRYEPMTFWAANHIHQITCLRLQGPRRAELLSTVELRMAKQDSKKRYTSLLFIWPNHLIMIESSNKLIGESQLWSKSYFFLVQKICKQLIF